MTELERTDVDETFGGYLIFPFLLIIVSGPCARWRIFGFDSQTFKQSKF